MRAKLNSSGQISVERLASGASTYTLQRCPFRFDGSATVTSLATCDHSCPHFQERPAGGLAAQYVYITCGSTPRATEYVIVEDARTSTSGETLTLLTSTTLSSVGWGGSAGDQFLGWMVKTTNSGTLTNVKLNLSSVSSAFSSRVSVYKDNNGVPSSTKTGGFSATASMSASTSQLVYTWSSEYPYLSSQTKYWFVFEDISKTGNANATTVSKNSLSLPAGNMRTGLSSSVSTLVDDVTFDAKASFTTSGGESISTMSYDSAASGKWVAWGDGISGAKYLAWKVTTTQAGTVSRAQIAVGAVTTAFSGICRVFTDNGSGQPNSQVGGNSSAVTVNAVGTFTFTWSSDAPSLSADTVYWITFKDNSAGSGSVKAEVTVDKNPLNLASGDMHTGVADVIVGSISGVTTNEVKALLLTT